jgi:hypothetical protein
VRNWMWVVLLAALPLMASASERSAAARNEAAVREYFDHVWSKGEIERLDRLLAPTYANDTPSFGRPAPGPEGLKPIVVALRAAFPDLHYAIEDMIATPDHGCACPHAGHAPGPIGRSAAHWPLDRCPADQYRTLREWPHRGALAGHGRAGTYEPVGKSLTACGFDRRKPWKTGFNGSSVCRGFARYFRHVHGACSRSSVAAHPQLQRWPTCRHSIAASL